MILVLAAAARSTRTATAGMWPNVFDSDSSKVSRLGTIRII